jgi:hypothetical protein
MKYGRGTVRGPADWMGRHARLDDQPCVAVEFTSGLTLTQNARFSQAIDVFLGLAWSPEPRDTFRPVLPRLGAQVAEPISRDRMRIMRATNGGQGSAFVQVAMMTGAIALGAAADLRAQQSGTPAAAPARSGFHFSIGLGSASVAASCAECEIDFFDNRLNGLSGLIQLGGAATSRLVVAAEFMGWMKNDAPIYRRIAALDLVVQGYPSETSGFFIKGGMGALRAIAENDFIVAQTDAWTAQTGLGYDIRLGGIMLTAYANYLRTFSGVTSFNDVSSPIAVMPNALQFGTALTFH